MSSIRSCFLCSNSFSFWILSNFSKSFKVIFGKGVSRETAAGGWLCTVTGDNSWMAFLSRNLVILLILLRIFAGLLCFIAISWGHNWLGRMTRSAGLDLGSSVPKWKSHSLAGIPHLAGLKVLKDDKIWEKVFLLMAGNWVLGQALIVTHTYKWAAIYFYGKSSKLGQEIRSGVTTWR